jgi:hypothetical protein
MDDDDAEGVSPFAGANVTAPSIAAAASPAPRRQSSRQYLESVDPVAAHAWQAKKEAGQADVARITAATKMMLSTRRPRPTPFGLAKGVGGD